MATLASATRARSLYRQLFRTARAWPVPEEALYIKQTTRDEFRQNVGASSEVEIKGLISEAEQRIEVGIHYANPYPRLVHADGGGAEGGNKRRKRVKSSQMQKKVNINGASRWQTPQGAGRPQF
jgi:hypothetical protein